MQPYEENVVTLGSPLLSRRFLWLLGVLMALMWAVIQVSRGQRPWALALLVLWAVLWFVTRKPVVVANAEGVRAGGRHVTPWSEVAAVRRPSDGPWKNQLPELVMQDGQRRSLPALSAEQLDTLEWLLQTSGRGGGGPTPP